MKVKSQLKSILRSGLCAAACALVCTQRTEAANFFIADATEFSKIINTNAVLTTNANLNFWIEGPVWIPASIPTNGFLVFSDRNNNKLRKLVPPNTLTDFLLPPANTKINGDILDLQERLISCEAGSNGLKVVLITNGVITPLVTNYYGKSFYSPNDAAVKSDGSIWFTDPGYDSGLPLPPPLGASVPANFQPGLYVYRFYETNGNDTILQVITNRRQPNGLCFSPDETKLYVADNDTSPGKIYRYDVTSSNTVTGGAAFCTVSTGIPDGIRCDVDGRIWSSAGDGVEIFSPTNGHLIGKILLTRTANLCFGGPDYKTLYMVGQPYVTSIPVLVAGAVSVRRLASSFDGTQMSISWPAPSTGYVLQESGMFGGAPAWTNVDQLPAIADGSNLVNMEATNAAKFFRLRLN
jgi:gluconolactonase